MRSKSTRADPIKTTLDRALKLQVDGKPSSAARLLVPLAKRHPDRAAIWGSMGSAYMDVENWTSAVDAYRHVIELSPRSERGSVGLFLGLWGLGETDNAFDEMRRFLTLAESDGYSTLPHDLAVEGRLGLRREPATVA